MFIKRVIILKLHPWNGTTFHQNSVVMPVSWKFTRDFTVMRALSVTFFNLSNWLRYHRKVSDCIVNISSKIFTLSEISSVNFFTYLQRLFELLLWRTFYAFTLEVQKYINNFLCCFQNGCFFISYIHVLWTHSKFKIKIAIKDYW